MATVHKMGSDVPSSQRILKITEVEAGDRFDIVTLLGKPARKILFFTTDANDEVEYKLNSLKKIVSQKPNVAKSSLPMKAFGILDKNIEEVWSGAGPLFENAGLVIELGEGLQIKSLEITNLNLAIGDQIQVVIW